MVVVSTISRFPGDGVEVGPLNPDEDEIDVACFERLLRGLDDGTVKSVTMR